MSKRLLVMAGGTGGHVFPGLAVANMLREQGWEIHWLGCATRMEADLVPRHNIDISYIDVEGVRGNGIVRLLKAPFKLMRSVWQAKRVIKQFKPDVILGMGGFASGPGGIAAKIAGIPLVLHEQNAVAGMTNRYLAKMATKVMVAFDGALQEHNPQVVGNPVRQDIVSLGRLTPQQSEIQSKESLKILLIGGSLGARALNEMLPQTLPLLDDVNLVLKHQAGKNNSGDVISAYQEAVDDCESYIEVTDFIDDMAAAYQWADMIICRAGALTVSEVAAVGLPAIFVPLPYAVDDHQTKNAQALSDQGAAVVMQQSLMTPQSLSEQIKAMNIDGQLERMHHASDSLAIVDATEQVASAIAHLAHADFVAPKKTEVV